MAQRRVSKRALAEQDLIEIALYLAKETGSKVIALRFLEAAERTCTRLLEVPQIGSPCELLSPRLVRMRRWAIPGFHNYFIFYRISVNGIEIIRVLHSARDISGTLEEWEGQDP